MEELINILKQKHGISESQSKNILETIGDFIKKKFPEAGGAVDSILSHNTNETSYYSKEQTSSSSAASYIPDSALKTDQQLSKDKQSGFYEGNKKDY